MPDVPFPYPGNKARLSDWIISHLPDHTCFVTVFGGAGGILFNKEPSKVEVYNDKDEHLVHFFTVLREREDELVEWLQHVPFSRKLHKKWVSVFYGNRFDTYVSQYAEKYDTDEDIVKAGIFFFLRYAQWGSKYGDNSGFAFSKVTNDAESFANARDRLDTFANRFDKVVIENLDWEDCMDSYDGEDTVFYLDPPYYKDTSDQHYRVTGFNHRRFVRYLGETEAKWVLSYAEIPPGLDEYNIESKESNFMIGNGKSGEAKQTTEHLIMNFESSTGTFHSTGQSSLTSMENGDDQQEDDSFKLEFKGIDDTSSNNEENTSEKEEPEQEKQTITTGGLGPVDGIASNESNSSDDEEQQSTDDEWDGFLEDI